ncbi:MazG-like family protein [Paenibacillus alkalitolerans]|uniref:MazG-like family protein n=1 Tax=Paenibacillus alkalitolerans TaxID=2799335 RepID=UPI0018F504B8|nr:MazG-like family protein [Paenibacillus alkalitolerans]
MRNDKEMDVAKKAKVIDWLKTEMLDQIAHLFRGLWEGKQEKIADSLASLVVSCYVLARRIGLSYRDLDQAIADKIRAHAEEEHQLEQWYGDMSALERHMDGR